MAFRRVYLAMYFFPTSVYLGVSYWSIPPKKKRELEHNKTLKRQLEFLKKLVECVNKIK